MRISSRMKLPCKNMLVAARSWRVLILKTYHTKGTPRSALDHASSQLVTFSSLSSSHWDISGAKGRSTEHGDRLLAAALGDFFWCSHPAILSCLGLQQLGCKIGLAWRAGGRPAIGNIYRRDGARHVGDARKLWQGSSKQQEFLVVVVVVVWKKQIVGGELVGACARVTLARGFFMPVVE